MKPKPAPVRAAKPSLPCWLVVLLLSPIVATAQLEIKSWSRLLGGAGSDFGAGIAVDESGNLAVGGPTQSALGGAYAGSFDVWAGKYDSSGNRLWLAQRGSSDIEYGFDDLNGGVATDAAGNVIVVGRTKGALDGNSKRGGFDYFVVKFDANGNWLWTRQDGTSQDDAGRAVASDASGNVYVTGFVRGDLHGVPRVGQGDVFVVKYGPTGNRLWTALFGSALNDEAFGITCDGDGNVIVTGWCDGSIDGIPNLGNGDNFLAKFSPHGDKLWLRQWGTPNKDTGYALATDAARNIYLSGYTTGPLYAPPAGNRDAFLAKFDAGGTNLWGRQIGTAEHDQGWGVATDAAGNAFLVGETGAQLGNDPAEGDLDVFVAKYNPSGTLLGLWQLGTSAADKARAVAVDAHGGVFVTGWSGDNFDGHPNAGATDVILLKFAPSNRPPPAPTARPATSVTTSAFTANWFPAASAVGYRLDVSTTSAFTSFLAGYQNLDVGNTTNRTVSGLNPGKTCYYRVRAYNAQGTSGNSTTIAVTTVQPICTPATLLNGSFELPDVGGIGTNWVGYQRPPNPTTVWSMQTANPPPGAGSRYQQIANTSSTGGGGVRQTITGCTPGATYVISGWMRGNSALATCRVKVSPTASTDWNTAIDLNPPQVYSGPDWTPFSGTVVATDTNMTLWLDGQTGGTGQNKAQCFDAVTVTCLAPPTPLRFESIQASGQSLPQLTLSGAPGQSVTIRHSSNLVDWVALTNLVLHGNTVQFTDPTGADAPLRFYRAVSP